MAEGAVVVVQDEKPGDQSIEANIPQNLGSVVQLCEAKLLAR